MDETVLGRWDRRAFGENALALLRIVFGFMMVWAFLDKLLGLGMLTSPEAAVINGGSPTEYYLTELVSGVFADFWHIFAGNPMVDFLLIAGLLLVGVALVAGIASRLATVGMCVMMLMMYTLSVPPSDNPLVDYHIAYILGMVAVYCLGGFDRLSLNGWWSELGVIRRFPVLR